MHRKYESDHEIMQLLRQTPSKGIEILMDQYSGLIYYIVRGKLGDRTEDIEECVSDVFVEFYNKFQELELEKGSIKAYLATMATRRAIDRYRKLAGKDSSNFDEMEEFYGDDSVEPENMTMEAEKRKLLLNEIKNLGEPDDMIMYRRYYLSQSVKEIAEDLGMKSNSVSKRISRALDTLRSRLEDYFYE